MIDLDTLRCKFVQMVYFWTGKMQWGIDCNIDYYLSLLTELYNYIQMLESVPECDLDDQVIDNIYVLVERINSPEIANLCNNC